MVTFSNTYTKLINFLIVTLITAAPIFAAEPILQKGPEVKNWNMTHANQLVQLQH